MDARAQLQALQQLDPSQLPPEEARRVWRLLLALCEQLLTEQQALRTALAAQGKYRQGKRPGRGPDPPPPPASPTT